MRRLLSSVPWLAVICAGLAALNFLTVLLGRGDWSNYVAGGFCTGCAVFNFLLHKSTRKAKKAVANNRIHSGGLVTSADLSKAFSQVYSSALASSSPRPQKPIDKKPAEFHGLPFEFAVGEVYGLRMWHMDQYGRLRARNWEGAPPWRPGVNVAKCVKREMERPDPYSYSFSLGSSYRWKVSDNPGHDVPSEQCTCGFYAYTDNLHAEVKPHAKSNGEEPVLGIIKGTGRTLIGTQGFRCEKAEIVAFRDPTQGGTKTDVWRTRQLASLRRVYPDVPILDSRTALLEFAPLTDTMPAPTSDEFWALP